MELILHASVTSRVSPGDRQPTSFDVDPGFSSKMSCPGMRCTLKFAKGKSSCLEGSCRQEVIRVHWNFGVWSCRTSYKSCKQETVCVHSRLPTLRKPLHINWETLISLGQLATRNHIASLKKLATGNHIVSLGKLSMGRRLPQYKDWTRVKYCSMLQLGAWWRETLLGWSVVMLYGVFARCRCLEYNSVASHYQSISQDLLISLGIRRRWCGKSCCSDVLSIRGIYNNDSKKESDS